MRTGLTPRELKRKLTKRDVAELAYYLSKNPVDDQSNFHMPIASLYALMFNLNRGETTPPITLQDALLFREKEDENDVEIGEAMGW
jgi:hypothetical protein